MAQQDSGTIPYRVLTTEDADAWRAALPTEACVMGSLELARIQERQLGQSARLFVAGSATARAAYPFFLRHVPAHPRIDGTELWDTTTSEYTGPLLLGQPGGPSPADFRAAFSHYCREAGIVAEFAHLNPWNDGVELLDPAWVEVNREIVYLDLTWGEEALWKQSLSSDTRRQTRQAMEAGVRVFAAETAQDVLAFHHLHHQTMERRSAHEHYYLPPEYFLSIFETMPNNAIFMLSEYQGRIVAGGLYYQDAINVYWHLSAVDLEFSKVRPVNAYHYEAIKRAVRASKQRLLCGGAFQTGDGVFRFKAGFSPLRIPFKLAKRIHDPVAYAELTEDWNRAHPGLQPDPGFFPAYRSSPLASTAPGTAVPVAE